MKKDSSAAAAHWRTIFPGALLFLVPGLHPFLIPFIGVPSHLLWWVHVLPVAMCTYSWGRKAMAVSIAVSAALLVVGERAFGDGYGQAASWETVAALGIALAGTNLLVGGFALSARRTAQRLSDFIESAPIGIVAVDDDEIVRRTNAMASRLLGKPATALLGAPARAVFGADVLQPGSTGPAEQIAATAPSTASSPDALRWQPVRLQRADGAWRDYEFVRLERSVDDSEVSHGLHQIAISDVTERNAMETRIRESQKMEAVGRLAGSVAHDFNNVITVVQGVTQMLMEEPRNAAIADELAEIRSASERATSLVRQLLTFARGEHVEAQVVDVDRLVAGMEPMLRRIAGAGINLVIDGANAPVPVSANPVHVEQVVLNLVTNARDAMSNGGQLRVSVSASRHDSHRQVASISVSDQGAGMSEEVRSRIFEPFFTTKERDKGTGLGLATVYGIVKRYRGEILVDSTPGAGTTFEVRMPVVQLGAA